MISTNIIRIWFLFIRRASSSAFFGSARNGNATHLDFRQAVASNCLIRSRPSIRSSDSTPGSPIQSSFDSRRSPDFMAQVLNTSNGDAFNIPFVIGGTYIYTPEIQFVFGVGVNVQSRVPVFPGGGIRWKFAPEWVLNAVLPAPRLEYQPNRELTLFAGANVKANTFRTDDRFGDSHGDTSLNNAWLAYEEVRAGVGAEWKINSSISLTIRGRLRSLARIRLSPHRSSLP